jgi:phosphate acetyltransferase
VILEELRARAKEHGGSIVLPESYDDRTLCAADEILREGLAELTLLGETEEILNRAEALGLDLVKARIIKPASHPRIGDFAEWLHAKRKDKGLTAEQAEALVRYELYFGALLVKFGLVGGMVAGAANTTADVLRAALQVVGVTPGLKTVSSCFIMVVTDCEGQDKVYLFGDCAVVPNPDASQLADIAISTASTRRAIIGDEPSVALLSFSTLGSSKHELVDKVIQARNILAERQVDFPFDGELQLDAAIVPGVAERKAPDSSVAGHANTLIFPDLQAGNIGYKLVQRLARAEAIGPIIQGLAAPVCDLSRGCSAADIVNTAVLVLLMINK